MRDFSAFSEVLGGIKLPKQVKEHLKNHEIWAHWSDIVGPELTRVTVPRDLKGRTLFVTVAHQAWAHQLHFLTPSILTKIRSLCPRTEIRELHYVVGSITPFGSESERRSDMEIEISDPVPLSERLEMTLRAVEDDKLRGSIRKAMEAANRRRKVG